MQTDVNAGTQSCTRDFFFNYENGCSVVYCPMSDLSGDTSKEASVLRSLSIVQVSTRPPVLKDGHPGELYTDYLQDVTRSVNRHHDLKRAFQSPGVFQFHLDGYPFPSTTGLH